MEQTGSIQITAILQICPSSRSCMGEGRKIREMTDGTVDKLGRVGNLM
jgi:hypothetical protein